MGQRLIDMADGMEVSGATKDGAKADPDAYGQLAPDRLLAIAQLVHKARKGRAEYFATDLFGDPAWDILLELFIAKLRGVRLSTTNLCLATAIPTATALRYVTHLEKVGLVARESCATDGRILWRSMTRKGFQIMSEYFATYWASLDVPHRVLLGSDA